MDSDNTALDQKIKEDSSQIKEPIKEPLRSYEEAQVALADCFLNSWIFTAGGAALGLFGSFKKRSYLPLAGGVLGGTMADIVSGCYRCQEEWQAVQAGKKDLARVLPSN